MLPFDFQEPKAVHVDDAFVYMHDGSPIGPAHAVPEPDNGSPDQDETLSERLGLPTDDDLSSSPPSSSSDD